MAGQMVEVRWHARGGQGAKTAAMFLAEAVLEKGKFGQGFPEYGPERRGAPMRGFTRIADTPIRRHCMIERPGIVIILDPTLLDSPAAAVTAGTDAQTVFLVNTTEKPATIRKKLGVKGAEVYTVDATGIALNVLQRAITNTAMMGAFARATGLVQMDSVKSVLEEKFENRADVNIQMAVTAFEDLRCHRFGEPAAEIVDRA